MLLDQPRDEIGIFRRQTVLPAEFSGIAAAKDGMVTAARLGDVVKQSRRIEHLGSREIGYQPRAQRVLVRVLRLGEPAQIADHHQDVRIDRVHVKQIVLPLTHAAP